MGIETEYGISALAAGSPAMAGGFGAAYIEDDLHPMQLSNHVVKAYGDLLGRPARGLGLRDRDPAARHPRLRDLPVRRASRPADRQRSGHGQRDLDQRRPALRRPRPPRVLRPRGHLRPRRGPLRQGRRRGDGDRRSAGHPVAGPLGPAVQEQHRRQGRLLRHPRELPAAAQHAVRPDRDPVHRVPGLPSGDHRRRAGRDRPGQPAGRASRSASGPTSSRPRSAWRPP